MEPVRDPKYVQDNPGKATPSQLLMRLESFALIVAIVLLLIVPGCTTDQNTSAEAIVIAPAFSERYEMAQAEAQSISTDSKLLVVSQLRPATEGVTPAWLYSFVSWDYAQVFQVIIDGDRAIADTTQPASFTQREFEQIPSVAGIIYDADAAYKLVAEQLPSDYTVVSCFSYLMTYVQEDEDPTAAAMKWFFVFNYQAPEENDYSVIEPESNADPNVFAYSVDAVSGEIERCDPSLIALG